MLPHLRREPLLRFVIHNGLERVTRVLRPNPLGYLFAVMFVSSGGDAGMLKAVSRATHRTSAVAPCWAMSSLNGNWLHDEYTSLLRGRFKITSA
jgi:hypothetical protein